MRFFLLALGTITIHLRIIAAPYQFRRMIILNDQKQLIKVIDLISDYHIPLHELVKRPSRKDKDILRIEEKTAFTTAERTLLITLRKLARENKTVELLWEEPAILGKVEDFQFPSDLSTVNWILYSHKLKDEFTPEKKSSIIYKNGDTYRFLPGKYDIRNLSLEKISDEWLDHNATYKEVLIKDLIAQIGDSLFSKNSKVESDLADIKNGPFNDYYKTLVALWDKYAKSVAAPFLNYLKETISEHPTITVADFRALMRNQPKNYQKLNELMHIFITQMADISFLIKLFGSSAIHTIIYSVGEHSDRLEELLTKNFNAKEIINIGTSTDSFANPKLFDPKTSSMLSPLLNAKTWVYLAQDPNKSFSRFKALGRPIVNLANNSLWYEFISLRNLMGPLSIQKTTPTAAQEEKIFNAIKNFLNQAAKTYIDFINVRDGYGKTLLHWSVQSKLFTVSDFLINHGTHVNIKDFLKGQTPLFYATTEPIAILLLKHGAQTDIKNFQNKTPQEHAKIILNDDLFEAIEKFEEKKKEAKKHTESIKESKQQIQECKIEAIIK